MLTHKSERQLREEIQMCTQFLSIEALTNGEIDRTLAERDALEKELENLLSAIAKQ